MKDSNLEDHDLWVGSGSGRLRLRLRHYLGEPGRPSVTARGRNRAVLMLHGGNTSSETFLLPEGGLARHLWENGCDVWLLDWRSSPHVLADVLKGPPLGGSESAERRIFTLDSVVAEDIKEAICELRRRLASDIEIALLGHCLGGGVISMAIARGVLQGTNIRNVVLSTLGLFYEVPWNGWIKAEDFLLERAIQQPGHRHVDPLDGTTWPAPFQHAYDKWPKVWLPPGGDQELEMLRRLTFMFGQPYAMAALHPSIRGPLLLRQFGPMHIGLYLHTSQMVRRGYAAAFDAPDVIDRPRERRAARRTGPPSTETAPRLDEAPPGDLNPQPFQNLNVTLICAAENQLWHRDAADLMYEWLRNHQGASGRRSSRKRVFERYRIQELLWGKNAKPEVYGAYLDGVCGNV